MKKHSFWTLLICLVTLPIASAKAATVVDGQSTEGKDFWVTFMQADQKTSDKGDWNSNYNRLILSLSISSREDCEVVITNPYTNYSDTVQVKANQMTPVDLYEGHPKCSEARQAMSTSGVVCYAVNSEEVDTCAIHVTSSANIALFATNYKKATFDATNVLPTPSLLDEYIIQTYTPSDHGGSAQGSHFAVIATEDNTVIDYCPSVNTERINHAVNRSKNGYTLTEEEQALVNYQFGRDTLHSPVLKKGQVWYVWTGEAEGETGDLSGTYVKAQGGKKIAVFQGCPHTNIPSKVKERDHIFSQAMPTKYWGNTFVLTGSSSRHRDFVRIMALNDGTEVIINDSVYHTFDFSKDNKQYWEFEFGDKTVKGGDSDKEDKLTTRPLPKVEGDNFVLKTSCPAAVHLFAASRQWDGNKKNDGDPSMLWVNPIEQQIDQVTFATYASRNGTTAHYTNVVTDKPALMTLDGISIADQFNPVNGSSTYHYARISLGDSAVSHTLKSNGSNFIAHVYGFTENESYGYSAGGATKPLTQYITINGEIFSPDTENKLCGEDTIKFACHPDYVFNKLEWNFGDGASKECTYEQVQGTDSVVPHYYENSGVYNAYVLIYRESSNVCVGQNAVDSIPITVTIGRYVFSIDTTEIPCPEAGAATIGKIYYSNPGHVDLKGDNVTLEFDEAAKNAGFKDEELLINDNYFQITVPTDAPSGTAYNIHLKIVSDCGGADTIMEFILPFSNDVIDQRYDNVLGLTKNENFDGFTLSDFQWYRASDSTKVAGQISSNLNFYDLPNGEFEDDSYYVCFSALNNETKAQTTTCACAKRFNTSTKEHNFGADSTNLTITAIYSIFEGDKVFVNADWDGKTDITCYAQWISASGNVYGDMKFDIPDGGCTIPAPNENGLYLLRVVTGKSTRSFKFIINKH